MAVVSTGQITITDVNDYTYQGTTAPKNPIPNVTVWIDTSVSPSVMKRWTGTTWEIVNEVKIGGRNYLKYSNDFSKWSLNNYSTITAERNLKYLDNYYVNQFGTNNFIVEEDSFYTISFTCLEATSSNIFVEFKNATTGAGLAPKRITLGKNIFTQYVPAGTYHAFSIFGIQNGSGYIVIKNDIKVEKGNKATDWTPAPEDIDSAILTAQNSANTANSLLADISNDNILSPSEKQSTKKEWDIIVGEKSVVESQANTLGVSTTSYVNAYNSLNSYVTPLLANLTVNSTIVGSDFRTTFKNYYDAKIALLKAVTDKLKSNTDNIQVGGRNLLRNSGNFLNTNFWSNYTSAPFVLNNNRLVVTTASTGSPRLLNSTLIPLTDSSQEFTVTVEYISEKEISLTGKSSNSLTIFNEAGSQIIGTVEKIKTTILELPNRKITEFRWNSIPKGTALSSWLMLLMPVDSVFEIIKVKVEKGNKATDWTPAPEDVVADYTALVNQEIADVKGEIAELETTVNGAFKDGIIQEAEAKAIEKYINSLNAEKSDIDNQYNTIYNDALLVDPTKQNLFNQKSSYNTAHSQLITSINTAIADGKTTTAEKADVDSKFTNYKNVLGGLSIRLTEALKAIEANRIDGIQVGGRNLILNSDSNDTIMLYGVTATYENVIDSQLPSKQYFKFTNVVRTIGNLVFFIPTLSKPSKFSQSLIGKKIQISFYIRSNNSQKLVFHRDTNQNFMIDSTWQKVRFNTVFTDGNLHFLIEGSSLTSFDISSVKIEFGDVATDWIPAPEDIQSQIDTESAKVINLENKTDFLTGTTIEGNAIATGTLLVGNSDGTNAGITGIIDRGSASVRLWAGATFAGKNTAKWLMRNDGVEEQWFNGILVRQRGVINGAYVETWYNLNGQIGKKITFSTDGKILEEWYNNGTLVYQIGQNGIYYVTELPLSWTSYAVEQISTNPLDSDATLITNIKAKLVFTDYTGTQYGDYAVINLDTTSAYFRFNAGRNIYSEQNKQYEKFYYASGANSSAPTATTPPKLANGWYCMNVQDKTEDIPSGGGLANYSFVVPVFLITSGEISEIRNLTISGSRRIHA